MNKKDIMKLLSIDSHAAEQLIKKLNPAAIEAFTELGVSGDISASEALCFQLFLAGDEPPKQPCGETFKTSGKAVIKFHEEITPEQLGRLIMQAYREAMKKAKGVCIAFSDQDCQTLEFVKYDFVNFDIDSNTGVATVEFIIIWKCVILV